MEKSIAPLHPDSPENSILTEILRILTASLLTLLFLGLLAYFLLLTPPQKISDSPSLKINLEKNTEQPKPEPSPLEKETQPIPEETTPEKPISKEAPTLKEQRELNPENFIPDQQNRLNLPEEQKSLLLNEEKQPDQNTNLNLPTEEELANPLQTFVEPSPIESEEISNEQKTAETLLDETKTKLQKTEKTLSTEQPKQEIAVDEKQSPQIEESGEIPILTKKQTELEKQFHEQNQDSISLVQETVPKEKPKDWNPADFIPEEIKPSLRGSKPEKTNHDNIQFTLEDYNWNFETYIASWATDLLKWWRAPADYISGKIPEGGSVWVRVKITNQGELIEYKIFHSEVTSEMQLKVVQTLISSFDRGKLPESFAGEDIIINWQFIYPPIGKSFDAKK